MFHSKILDLFLIVIITCLIILQICFYEQVCKGIADFINTILPLTEILISQFKIYYKL